MRLRIFRLREYRTQTYTGIMWGNEN